MPRKNIFEIMNNSFSLRNDVERINRVYSSEYLVMDKKRKSLKLEPFINSYCFSGWKNRGRFVDYYDLREEIYKSGIPVRATAFIDCYFTYIEFVYNMWEVADCYIKGHSALFAETEMFLFLKRLMDECLSQYNYKAFYDVENQKVLVIEDKPEVTAVAEIVSDNVAKRIIRYNHYSLKNDIENKKSILVDISRELEPKRTALKKLDRTLEDVLFNGFNNMDIRHNNADDSSDNKYYKALVNKMEKDEIESIYDDLYQLSLLAFLVVDNEDRKELIKQKMQAINVNK